MSLFKRLKNTFTGMGEGRLAALEANNPKAVYAAAIEASEARIAALKASLVKQLADQRYRGGPDEDQGDQAAETRAALDRCQQDLKDLKVESTRAVAQHELAAARIATQEIATGLSEDADIRGLGNVRQDIERLHEKAHQGWLDSQGRPVHARVAQLKEQSALQKAQDELARLKALRDGGGEE
jgi:phage shock protein A